MLILVLDDDGGGATRQPAADRTSANLVISCRETLLRTVEHAITPSQPLRIHMSQSHLLSLNFGIHWAKNIFFSYQTFLAVQDSSISDLVTD